MIIIYCQCGAKTKPSEWLKAGWVKSTQNRKATYMCGPCFDKMLLEGEMAAALKSPTITPAAKKLIELAIVAQRTGRMPDLTCLMKPEPTEPTTENTENTKVL